MSDFDYKTAPLVEALRHYLKDMPDLGYNGQYLMREAMAEIERLEVDADISEIAITRQREKIERLKADKQDLADELCEAKERE